MPSPGTLARVGLGRVWLPTSQVVGSQWLSLNLAGPSPFLTARAFRPLQVTVVPELRHWALWLPGLVAVAGATRRQLDRQPCLEGQGFEARLHVGLDGRALRAAARGCGLSGGSTARRLGHSGTRFCRARA